MDNHTKYFIDTNILVYAYDISAADKHIRARNIIKELWNNGNGGISVQILQEFFVTTTQKVEIPLSINQVKEILADISFWRVHCPTPNDVLRAIDIKEKYHISFWDSMIIASAKSLNCNIIFTEDLNHGQLYEGIKVVNPFVD